MQNWFRIYHYPKDFLELVYRYYAVHGIAYICNYYHLDIPSSCVDTDVLDAGSYEAIGNLSGMVWEKISMLPIYNTESIQPAFTADERGFGKFDQETSFNIPSVYGIVPTTHDYVVFDEVILNEGGDEFSTKFINNGGPPANVPIYRVKNFEKATNTFITFWKINVKVSQYGVSELDKQVRDVFAFYDYEKRIYPLENTTNLYKLMDKNKKLGANKFFLDNAGFYFGT